MVPARRQPSAAPWQLHADVRRRQGSRRGCAGAPRGHRDRQRLDIGPAGGRRGLRWRSPARSAACRPGPPAGARLARPRWVPSRLGCGGHAGRSGLVQRAAWAARACAGPVSHSRRHASLGSASPPSNARAWPAGPRRGQGTLRCAAWLCQPSANRWPRPDWSMRWLDASSYSLACQASQRGPAFVCWRTPSRMPSSNGASALSG